MPSPAGRPQRPRTVIQWHDDGPKPRVRHFLPDDASPYRALLLAGSMAIISVACVAAVIQYQRHGSFPEMGGLVEMAAASPDGAPKSASPAKLRTDTVKSVQAHLVTRTAPEPTVASPDVEPAAADEAQSEKAARIDAEGAVASALLQPISPSPAGGQEETSGVDVQKRVELAVPVEPGGEQEATGPVGALGRLKASGGPGGMQSEKETGEILAFAPTQQAPAAPPPAEAAPRTEEVVATVQKPKNPQVVEQDENATVRSAVNLRAGPSDGAKVLLTIPRGAKIQVDGKCRHWCAVTYDGRNGFVYKSFIRR